ncbi:MAG: 50S ribosomal protein L1, partial [Candidatus Nanohaloarchaea archaeon]
LMPDIGQHLGQVLGPRNMMPDPMPPGSDPTDQVESLRNTVTVRLKEDPVLHQKVGNEEQDLEQVARNASAVYDFIEEELPQGSNNLKSVLVKTTMGPSIEVNQ